MTRSPESLQLELEYWGLVLADLKDLQLGLRNALEAAHGLRNRNVFAAVEPLVGPFERLVNLADGRVTALRAELEEEMGRPG